jgi:hypothetical protein
MGDANNSSHRHSASAAMSFMPDRTPNVIDARKIFSDSSSAKNAAVTSLKSFAEPVEEKELNEVNGITAASSAMGTYPERMDCFPYVHGREVRK